MYSQVQRQLQHDAIFYDDESTLAAAAASFVRGGVEQGEMVLVNTGTDPVTSLLSAMFSGEDQVVFAEGPVYSTPAAALDDYRRTMERGLATGALGYRAIGFVDFENSPLPWQEWLRYEAAVNRVFADFPFQTLCPYDTSKVSEEIIDAMKRAHTGLVEPDGWHRNDDYLAPERLVLEDGLVTPPHPLQASPPRMVLQPEEELTDLRMEVYAATMFTSLPAQTVDDLVAAVGEVVANAHKHGRPPVVLKLWATDDTVVCTVSDQGPGIDDPLLGYARPRDPSEGLGLWAARQLCDLLDFQRGPEGFTVRVAAFA